MKSKTFLFSLFFLFFLGTCKGGGNLIAEEDNKQSFTPRFLIEGKIIFQSNFDGDNEIYLIEGKNLKKLTDNTWEDEYPVWSPEGKRIAFSANPKGNYDIFVLDLESGGIKAATSLSSDEKSPCWFPDGKRIAFSRHLKKFLREEIDIFEVSLSTGEIKKVISDFSRNNAIPHISPSAPLLTFTAKRTIGWDVALYDLEKRKSEFLTEGGKGCRARFSRDGKKLVYVDSSADGKGDIWIMNHDGSEKTRLTFWDKTYDYFPCFSPDGKNIAFNSSSQRDHNGDWKLFIFDLQSREARLLFDSPGNDIFPDWY